MKKRPASLLLILTILAAILLGNTYTAEAITTSKWYTKASSFEKIEEAAQKKNKPYILFFYTDWCGYCKKMNKKYLSNAKIKLILAKHYRIKINPDNGEEEKALATAKGVNGYPDFRIVHPDGHTLRIHPFRDGGSLKVKAFIRDLKAALKGKS
ncbi:MAG: thioredoxin family protein [Candidatus Electrothrix sp. GW3-4]|uniref:thioredoxin family protein n=1 Tax=Candidatus Electrothrix sp. GW3-4 TaxID=3126740 RepID=UPI0030D13FFF